MSALTRAAEFFVAPAGERAAAQPSALAAPGSTAVLGAARDAVPIAAAFGALVAVWDLGLPHVCVPEQHEREAGPLATPAAARLARWASGRGHDAVARGRTVRVTLAADPRRASAEASRLAAATDARVVTVLAGPREPAFDELLAEQDRVVVVTRPDTDPDLLALTLAGLGSHAVAVPSLTGPARLLASAGWLRRDPATLAALA